MSKKGGGGGDGKITPKNPSLRMRPRGGFWGGGGGGGEILVLGNSGNSGLLGLLWPSTRSGQKIAGSVKTDLIAVERNLVSGNKNQKQENIN